jgi:hypothetical protein
MSYLLRVLYPSLAPHHDFAGGAAAFRSIEALQSRCASPEEDCAAFAVRAINNAQRGSSRRLRTDNGLGHRQALVRAKGRVLMFG